MRVGAIDIGSNSIRLLVADVAEGDGGPLATVARAGESCRLGRNLGSTGMIDPAQRRRHAPSREGAPESIIDEAWTPANPEGCSIFSLFPAYRGERVTL